MVGEVSLVVGTPEVYRGEIKHGRVELRAAEIIPGHTTPPNGLSVHYAAGHHSGMVPAIGDHLLVAVMAGVHESWLGVWPDAEKVPIEFQAISADRRALKEDGDAFDMLHLGTKDVGKITRLRVTMTNESGSQVRARVVLSKGQVVSLLAALLAQFDRLTEE